MYQIIGISGAGSLIVMGMSFYNRKTFENKHDKELLKQITDICENGGEGGNGNKFIKEIEIDSVDDEISWELGGKSAYDFEIDRINATLLQAEKNNPDFEVSYDTKCIKSVLCTAEPSNENGGYERRWVPCMYKHDFFPDYFGDMKCTTTFTIKKKN